VFDWFEIVTVVKCDKHPEVINQQGYVAGKSFSEEDADGGPAPGSTVTGYGVLLFQQEQVFFFLPDAIKTTGYMLATQRDEGGSLVPIEVEAA